MAISLVFFEVHMTLHGSQWCPWVTMSHGQDLQSFREQYLKV